jgi:hypothetical protein
VSPLSEIRKKSGGKNTGGKYGRQQSNPYHEAGRAGVQRFFNKKFGAAERRWQDELSNYPKDGKKALIIFREKRISP